MVEHKGAVAVMGGLIGRYRMLYLIIVAMTDVDTELARYGDSV